MKTYIEEAMLYLDFDRGSILLSGGPLPLGLEDCYTLDTRVGAYRTYASNYARTIRALHKKIEYQDRVKAYQTLAVKAKFDFAPRDYQEASINAWIQARRQGLLILPTGSGKSFVAQLAIELCQRSSIIIVPTIDLLHQWHGQLEKAFSCEVGQLGGGERNILPITVSTYDSAIIHFEQLGNQFGLIVFDECHHLPSEKSKYAALACIAPFRLGLTATPERTEQGLDIYDSLIGPIVYRLEIDQLAGGVLAPYRVDRCELDLEPDELERYLFCRQLYLDFLHEQGISFKNGDGWARFIMATCRSKGGREVMRAFQEQKQIARSGRAKMEKIWQILSEHEGERMVIFTADNDTAYKIGQEFFLPVLTHLTKPAERKAMLANLRSARHPVLVSSRVLNEGVDVPEVSVGIVVSGTGSVREHVQRLGRILRQAQGKEAILYELVSAGTSEMNISERRREHRAYQR